jgi:hypothetical protein
MGIFPSQGYTAFHLRLRENDTPSSWASSLHRGTQHSIFVSDRNDTPISWAHPTHGLSHKPTHSICVLEDVSCSCNHRQSGCVGISWNGLPNLQNLFPILQDLTAFNLTLWKVILSYVQTPAPCYFSTEPQEKTQQLWVLEVSSSPLVASSTDLHGAWTLHPTPLQKQHPS